MLFTSFPSQQTVSLIKKELTPDIISDLVPEQERSSAIPEIKEPKSEKEFTGLTTLLEDSSVKSAIKSVAGDTTQAIIDKALVALKASESVDDKSKVLSEGIKKLHVNLRQSDKAKLQNDPLFNLAINFMGIRQGRKN